MINLYLIASVVNNEKLYKIGFTRRTIEKRMNDFKTGNAGEIYLVDMFVSKWSIKIEKCLHRLYKNKRIKGEWFRLEDYDVETFIDKCQLYHTNFEILNKDNIFLSKKEYKKEKI